MNDEQPLIARAQRGDTDAYTALVQQYEMLAFRAAYLIVRDEADAADAAQEAFLRAYRALGSFTLGQPFRPWLLRIVTNQALNRLQAAARRARMNERYIEHAKLHDDSGLPERAAIEREQHERLLQAVRRLSADEQALITLRYFLELPESEVAQTLRVPLGTIKSRLHRTLNKLRDIIRREFADLSELVVAE
jgi:RNA polymerase sigma-70 factor (ECF subfamily)